MSALHIALVTETYAPEINGVAMTLSRWVDGLQARGHSLEVWRPQPLLDSPPHLNGTLTEHRVRGFSLPMYPELRIGIPSGARLAAHWRTRRPDLLYIATEGPLGWSALRAARRLGIPIVSGFHTRFDHYTGHYHLGLFMPLVRGYLRRFHRATALTLAPTPQLCRALEDDGFGRMAVVPRGVDTALYAPERRNGALRARWGVVEDQLAVLYVGRLAAEKNLTETLRSFRALQTLRPDARLILVGDGPLRAALEQAHPDLIFAGMQHGTALAEQYASADLFLFPSLSETFGNVTLEAMASGLPVIAFEDAAAAMHMRHRDNGMLIPKQEPALFAEAARELACDADLRRS
ncbi:MAG TPA: glycosyltransferase family 1 protein, partial [Gammaproteobacteria bacterium]